MPTPTAEAVPVTPGKPAPVGDTAKKAPPPAWYEKLCPKISALGPHSEKLSKLKFDMLFAGAKATGKWEDEWPLMTEETFVSKLKDVSELSLGGHNPDGTHPDAFKSEE